MKPYCSAPKISPFRKNWYLRRQKPRPDGTGFTTPEQEQQLCITLFYLEKKTYQQVAEISGYSMMQVKSHIQNGKRNLRSHIQRLQEDHER